MKFSTLSLCTAVLMTAPAVAFAQTDEKLTIDSLTKMVSGLGFEPKKVGDTVQRIEIERDKFTFRINLSVSGNTKKVWMSSYLVEIPDLSKVPANLLSDLLVSNGEIGPAHFYLVKLEKSYWLKMGFALDNRSITPAYFRGELDWFLEKMSETAKLWDKSKWPSSTPR